MDEFLGSFDETKRSENDQLITTRKNILTILETTSKVLINL